MYWKKSYVVLCSLLILASGLFFIACEDGWEMKPLSYQVTGQVLNRDGEGVPDVTLLFTGDDEGSTSTQEDGSYSAILRGEVTITPTKEEYIFDPPYQEVSEETHNLDFTLSKVHYTLQIHVIGQGHVDVSPEEDEYEEGSVITLRAVPKEGWYFEEWRGDSTEEENPISLKMDSDKEITALFLQEEASKIEIHSLDLSSGSGRLLLEEYGFHDKAYILLYSMDESGSTHVVEKISASYEGDPVEEIDLLERQPLEESTDLLRDASFIWEKEEEVRRNHLWASQISPLLELESDPELYTQEEFKIYLEHHQQETITATLLHKGENYLLWVEENQDLPTPEMEEITSIYKNTIQPLVTEYFGREPTRETFPLLEERGERVNILLAPMIDYGGYFYSVDLYSSEVYPESNERKIIYVAYDSSKETDYDYLLGTITHELQHMIFYHERILAERPDTVDDIWINEGFSLLSEDITGYGYEQGAILYHVYRYSQAPHETSLISWEGDWPDYGITYLFARYIFDRFGRDILPTIYTSPLDPRFAQEELTEMDFQKVFEDWALALLLHQIEGINPRYSFDSITLDLMTVDLLPGTYLEDQGIKGYGVYYLKIGPGHGEDLLIEIEGAALDGQFKMIVVEM